MHKSVPGKGGGGGGRVIGNAWVYRYYPGGGGVGGTFAIIVICRVVRLNNGIANAQ